MAAKMVNIGAHALATEGAPAAPCERFDERNEEPQMRLQS
jgi:hypothetical protein